jgi:hypothetical protein
MEGSPPNAQPPAEPEKKEPTLAEVQEIAIEASKVAAEAKSAAEAKENVQTSIETETEKRGIEFSDEDYKKMADAIIVGMEARGVFEEGPEPTPTQEPSPPDGSQPPTAQPSSTSTPPVSEPPADSGPKKRTFAERFVGRK